MTTADPSQSPDTTTANPPSAADLLGPGEVLRIQEQGRRAFHAGGHPSDCPWAGAESAEDQARREQWARGFAYGRAEVRDVHQAQAGHASPPGQSGPGAPADSA